jgi:toxin HigB-1
MLVAQCATRYHLTMIKSFRHKGLRRFFESGNASGVQPAHTKRLRMLLAALDTARVVDDMAVPGFRLHALKGTGRGRWSVWVNGNWRMTFAFQDGDAHVLDYEDYH